MPQSRFWRFYKGCLLFSHHPQVSLARCFFFTPQDAQLLCSHHWGTNRKVENFIFRAIRLLLLQKERKLRKNIKNILRVLIDFYCRLATPMLTTLCCSVLRFENTDLVKSSLSTFKYIFISSLLKMSNQLSTVMWWLQDKWQLVERHVLISSALSVMSWHLTA